MLIECSNVPLFHWSIGPLVDWPIGPLVHWSFGPLVHGSIGPLVHWLNVNCQMSKSNKVIFDGAYLRSSSGHFFTFITQKHGGFQKFSINLIFSFSSHSVHSSSKSLGK